MTDVLITGNINLQKNDINFISGNTLTLRIADQSAATILTLPDTGGNASIMCTTNGNVTITNAATNTYGLVATSMTEATWQNLSTSVSSTSFEYQYTLNSVAVTQLTTSNAIIQHFGGTNDNSEVRLPSLTFGNYFIFVHDGSGTLTIKGFGGTGTYGTVTGSGSISLIGVNGSVAWAPVQSYP